MILCCCHGNGVGSTPAPPVAAVALAWERAATVPKVRLTSELLFLQMQQQELAQMRQRDANLTALAAIGPRKKRKLDSPGGPAAGSEVGRARHACCGAAAAAAPPLLRWRLVVTSK